MWENLQDSSTTAFFRSFASQENANNPDDLLESLKAFNYFPLFAWWRAKTLKRKSEKKNGGKMPSFSTWPERQTPPGKSRAICNRILHVFRKKKFFTSWSFSFFYNFLGLDELFSHTLTLRFITVTRRIEGVREKRELIYVKFAFQ